MLEVVERDEVKENNRNRRLTMSEKRAVADGEDTQFVDTNSLVEKYDEDNTSPVQLEIEPPDKNIKDMLSVIKGETEPGEQSAEGEVKGEVPPEIAMVTIDIKILKGLLQTIYTAPYFIYRTGRYEMSEFVSVNLDARASQLQMVLQIFGFVDPKYLVLLAFGGGFAMDMAMLIGDARELGQKAKEERELKKQTEFAKMTEEQRMLKQGLAANK